MSSNVVPIQTNFFWRQMQMLKHAVIGYNLYAISLYAYLIYLQKKCNAKFIFTWKLFLICAWNVTNLIILFVCNCAMEHKKMLLVFYYNTCHFCFLSTTAVPFISITKRQKTQNLSFSWQCLKMSPLIAKHSHLGAQLDN